MLLALCAAADAVAAAILLVDVPLSPLLQGVVLAVTHETAVLVLFFMTRGRPSRRWLCVAAVTLVPLVGAAVAAATLVTRGRATAATGPHPKARPRPALTMAAMERLGDSLSPCDALSCDDEEARHAAMSALSQRGDREAIALLRWAAAGHDADLALSAALALDEIGKRAERRGGRLDRAEVRREAR
jgi:hypothetical protein